MAETEVYGDWAKEPVINRVTQGAIKFKKKKKNLHIFAMLLFVTEAKRIETANIWTIALKSLKKIKWSSPVKVRMCFRFILKSLTCCD